MDIFSLNTVLHLIILVGWATGREEESANTNSLMQEACEVHAGPVASLLQKLPDEKLELREDLSTIQASSRE